jgi:formylglycine-generating enzyme required for sulfatase activity
LEQHYFSHPAYDHFPVVNVSREGAEMYCVWFTKELNNILKDKEKTLVNDVRIPCREEWVMAASIEGKNDPYPWGDAATKNSEGLRLANYLMTIEEFQENAAAEFQDVTAPVKSNTINDFGLYNMSGNAAEMVYDDIKLKTAGTAGGGWMSKADEIKIKAPDKYSGITNPHPCIGFRVVMTVK